MCQYFNISCVTIWILYNFLVLSIICEPTVDIGSYFTTITCNGVLEEFDSIRPVNDKHLEGLYIKYCPLQKESLFIVAKKLQLKSVKELTVEFNNKDNDIHFETDNLVGFVDLKSLKISTSGNLSFGSNLLKDLTKLESIYINAKFIEFSKNTFRHGNSLKNLDIGPLSIIKGFHSGMFENLTSLNSLVIYNIKLESVDKETFKGLKNLKELDFSENNIRSLESDVFYYLNGLTNLTIGCIEFNALPVGLFNTTTNLRVFSMICYNNSIQLPSKFLASLKHLKSVEIVVKMETVTEDIFEDSLSLESIVLKCNISKLPIAIFMNLKNLTTLNLSKNRLTEIHNNLFMSLRNLKKLDLSANQIDSFEGLEFETLTSIEVINLKKNKLIHLGSVFHGLENLKILNLSHNKINTMFSFHNLKHLKKVDMSYNKIMELHHEDYQNIESNVTIDLSSNNISSVNFDGFEERKLSGQGQITFTLKNNTLICDCSMIHFLRHIQSSNRKGFNFQLDNVFCSRPIELSSKLVTDLLQTDLHCSMPDIISCPETCTCQRRAVDETLIVNCSNRNLTAVPRLPNAVTFNLNNTELFINDNKITELPCSIIDPAYDFVSKINAANNWISKLNLLNIPKNLVELNLRKNNFNTINFKIINETQTKLKIGVNPWNCGCTDLFWIYLHNHHSNVEDYDDLRCKNTTLIKHLTPNYCKENPNLVIVWIFVCFALLGLIIGVVFGLFYKYQQEIKVWLFARNMFLWYVTEDELDKDKKYDVFISYSQKDETFIIDHLVPELETGSHPYKLCLHFRDWIPGEMIPNQITKSVEESRRTLIVLSNNFLESVWGQMEFRAAHSQAMSEGRSRVILIIYGKIENLKSLDSELKSYIKMNTYVEWGDSYFWNKLKYALPHQRRRN